MKNDKINALNALGLRKVNFPAVHFRYMSLPKFNPSMVKVLDEWIYENMNGRYYIGSSLDLIDNSIVYTTRIGFEIEKEISFFKIACPHI